MEPARIGEEAARGLVPPAHVEGLWQVIRGLQADNRTLRRLVHVLALLVLWTWLLLALGRFGLLG